MSLFFLTFFIIKSVSINILLETSSVDWHHASFC